MIAPPILSMVGLSKSFGTVQAVSDANLEVEASQAVALMGANGAGKSTLMNMLGGVIEPDHGRILLDGQPAMFSGPRDAAQAGISFVQQELSTFATMTIADNIFIDEFPLRLGRLDRRAMRQVTNELLSKLGAELDPDSRLESLSTGERQMVEIARAMRRRPRIIIFDEPTSSLTSREKSRLHEVIHQLKSQGVAIVYVTHFVREIFEVCDRVSIMRNGATVADRPIAETSYAEVVRTMLGDIASSGRMVNNETTHGDTILKIEGLALPGRVEHAQFDLRQGEILGVWGLLGAGRTELARAILGLDGQVHGRIMLRQGEAIAPVTSEALRAVTAFVTEDRRGEGLLLPFSVAENVLLPNLDALSGRAGRIKGKALNNVTRSLVEQLKIKVSGIHQRVGTLSGGNQQKVVFGKWLASKPRILILDEPTRGLDLHAKADILRLVVDLAAEGAAVLFISSEVEELMRVSHRYLVIAERRTVGELPGAANEADLIAALA
ncbi:MAG: sugar ABC transporter ATP-binding protein, partial [Pseudomonadota bacterium]